MWLLIIIMPQATETRKWSRAVHRSAIANIIVDMKLYSLGSKWAPGRNIHCHMSWIRTAATCWTWPLNNPQDWGEGGYNLIKKTKLWCSTCTVVTLRTHTCSQKGPFMLHAESSTEPICPGESRNTGSRRNSGQDGAWDYHLSWRLHQESSSWNHQSNHQHEWRSQITHNWSWSACEHHS